MIRMAILVVAVHLLWLLAVIFGALWTHGRPVWSAAHILALLWGIAVEIGPWPCPLTLAEESFELRAGLPAYHSSFVLHLLESIVYPNLPGWLVAAAGSAVCVFNLGIYAWRWRRARTGKRASL
ncbi:MAG: DUF2784 domain-containing protein [Terracidiphilus sp.]